jgi:hypothetical protein
MLKMNDLPILSTIPRSGTWFLRYTISFLCHLDRGGRIDDRLTGDVVGDPSGAPFDFQRFKGGPLFRVQGTMPADHLFIGHTVCPGFAELADAFDWWTRTPFHVPGYDYLHEGMNYQYTPVELAPYKYAPVRVPTLERCARKGRGQRIVLVYRNPLGQAASYYRYCQDHKDPTYSSFKGRPLASVPFHDYLFESGLPSYAKQFISFQALAMRHPDLVRLVPYERLMRQPLDVVTSVLDHLSGAPRYRPALRDAVWLARSEHLSAIEKELGRSLDGTRNGRGSHMRQGNVGGLDGWADGTTCSEAMTMLRDMGVDTDLIEWPSFRPSRTFYREAMNDFATEVDASAR